MSLHADEAEKWRQNHKDADTQEQFWTDQRVGEYTNKKASQAMRDAMKEDCMECGAEIIADFYCHDCG